MKHYDIVYDKKSGKTGIAMPDGDGTRIVKYFFDDKTMSENNWQIDFGIGEFVTVGTIVKDDPFVKQMTAERKLGCEHDASI